MKLRLYAISKRKRTVWMIGLVAFLVFLAAVFLSRGEGVRPKALTLVGYTNMAGGTRALFSFERSDNWSLFNLTSWEHQITQLVTKDKAGAVETNAAAKMDFVWVGGDALVSVPIPANTTEYSVEYGHKQRQGRTRDTTGPGPPKTLFVLPWGKVELFRSGRLFFTNEFGS